MNERVSNPEHLKPSGIKKYVIPQGDLPRLEADAADGMGRASMSLDRRTWVADVEDPEARTALGAMGRLTVLVVTAKRNHYDGLAVLTSGDPEQPGALMLGSSVLDRDEIGRLHHDAVTEVNTLLERLQSPHRL